MHHHRLVAVGAAEPVLRRNFLSSAQTSSLAFRNATLMLVNGVDDEARGASSLRGARSPGAASKRNEQWAAD